MWWAGSESAVAKHVANEAANGNVGLVANNTAKEFAGTKTPQKKDTPKKRDTPQKKKAAEPMFPMVSEPPGLPKFDERETQNHISAPEESMEVPLSFKREYEAEEFMEYPGTLFNGKSYLWILEQ